MAGPAAGVGPKVFDRVRDTTSTTGTGTVTLANAPPTGYRSFASVLSNGNTCFYTIAHQTANEWEVGVGTYTSVSTTLARTTVLSSSNAGSAVSFSAGTKDVLLSLPAAFSDRFQAVTAAYASLSAFEAGRLLLPSDGFHLMRDTGSGVAAWGPVFPMTVPDNSAYAWVNQDSATLTDGGAISVMGVSGSSLNCRVKTLPAAPYTLTACLLPTIYPASGGGVAVGLLLRDSASGKLFTFQLQYGPGASADEWLLGTFKWDSATVFNTTGATVGGAPAAGGPLWLRFVDDNTNRKASFSRDGVNFTQIDSRSRTDFLTPNQAGFCVLSLNGATGVTLLSWLEQ